MPIAVFVSDARPLYKTNIFRALALPNGYVWQYRYRRTHIHGNLVVDLNALKGQAAVLFFTTGNNLAVPENQRVLTHHPIRHVTVRDVVDDQVLGRVHFFLEMGDFADVAPHQNTPAADLPPTCMVTQITTDNQPAKNWAGRVADLAAHFPDQMFFRVRGITRTGFWGKRRLITPVYSVQDRASRYALTEESEYQAEISFYDPKGGTGGLAADNSSPDAALIVPGTHYLGAEADTTIFPLQTHTLARRQLLAQTVLKERERPTAQPAGQAGGGQPVVPAPTPPPLDVQIQWRVTRGGHKSWVFGLLAILAAVGLGLAKLATDDLSKTTLEWRNLWIALGAAVCVGVPAGLLYWLFHKK